MVTKISATASPADDGKGATKAPRRGRVAASATRVLASGRAAAKAVTNTAARAGSAALSAASDLGELVAQASAIETSTLDGAEKGRAQFFASLVTDALAPSNFVLGNPVAVRKIVDTGGNNLVKGLQHLVHDIRHNRLMPSQVDTTPFKLGE